MTPTTRNPSLSAARVASRIAVLLSMLLGLSAKSGAEVPKEASGKGMRVLFLGNSLTYSNNLPGMVQALAKAAGEDLYVDSVTHGGANLEDLWNDGEALRLIDQGGWNVVVMQQGPSSLPEPRADLREWGARFAERMRKKGARPAFYMVWPTPDRAAYFDDVVETYTLAAKDVNGMLLPAGEAMRAARRRDPKVKLLSFDDFHPSDAGTYVAALSIYGMLYKKAPQGLPAKLQAGNRNLVDLPPKVAKLLQDAATEANEKFGKH